MIITSKSDWCSICLCLIVNRYREFICSSLSCAVCLLLSVNSGSALNLRRRSTKAWSPLSTALIRAVFSWHKGWTVILSMWRGLWNLLYKGSSCCSLVLGLTPALSKESIMWQEIGLSALIWSKRYCSALSASSG